jgi:hypothetical protein
MAVDPALGEQGEHHFPVLRTSLIEASAATECSSVVEQFAAGGKPVAHA